MNEYMASDVCNERSEHCEEVGVKFIKHPNKSSLWKRLKYFFVRPRFSANSIEPAKKAIDTIMAETLKDDEYKCKQCGLVWGFEPEQYDIYGQEYPSICPFCAMPLSQMIRDIYLAWGAWEVLKQIIRRYLKIKIPDNK